MKTPAATYQNVILGYVVSRSVKKQGSHHIRRRGHFNVRWRIGFHEIKQSASVANTETSAYTFRFGGNHRIRRFGGAMYPAAFFQRFNVQTVDVAVRKPTRIRHLAQRINAS